MQSVFSTIQRDTMIEASDVQMLGGLAHRIEYDYVYWYGPGDGGTVVAELRWGPDGSIRFEREGSRHHLAPDSTPERIVAHWLGFVETARAEYLKDKKGMGERDVCSFCYGHNGNHSIGCP